jgi:lipid A oxidase
MFRSPIRTAAAALALAAATPALAETELSFYLGAQEAAHSRVSGTDPGGVEDFSFLAAWQGRSFEMPPYYGARATWWRNARLGYALEFTHAKIYASDATRAASGFSTLEFTDGLNILTANVMYRWPQGNRRWTPYVGAGLGVSIPYVEVVSTGGSMFDYQLSGPAVTAIAGVSYKLNDRWSAFGEYKFAYSRNTVDLGSGGTMKTNNAINALNFGLSWSF